MKVRFLADADLNRAIVSGLLRREPSIDFLTAAAAGLRGVADAHVLALAAQPSECSFHSMPDHAGEFRKAGKHSAGVFLVPQALDTGTAIEEGLLIWLAPEASEWVEPVAVAAAPRDRAPPVRTGFLTHASRRSTSHTPFRACAAASEDRN